MGIFIYCFRGYDEIIYHMCNNIFLITNYCFADVFDTIRDTNIVRTNRMTLLLKTPRDTHEF